MMMSPTVVPHPQPSSDIQPNSNQCRGAYKGNQEEGTETKATTNDEEKGDDMPGNKPSNDDDAGDDVPDNLSSLVKAGNASLPGRRRSSSALEPRLLFRPMNSSFVFRPKMRAVLGQAGKRACRFEAKQIMWVLVMIIPTLAGLLLMMVYEPFVKEVPLDTNVETEGLLVTAIDPVGFNTVVWTGALVGAMLCSWTSNNNSYEIPFFQNMVLLSALGGIGTAMYFAMHFITTKMGFKVNFYLIDILCTVFFYFLWQMIAHMSKAGKLLKYPLKSNLITGQASTLDKNKTKNLALYDFIFCVLLPLSLLGVYMLVLIPSFASASPPVQFFLRCVGHTFIKGQQDMRQRDSFANGEFPYTVKCASLDMFGMEAVYSLLGRFLVSSSANSSTGWYFATLLTTSYMEFFSRVNAEAIKCFFRVYIHKTGPLTGRKLQNYRIAEAASQAQADCLEQVAVFVASACLFALHSQKAAFNLGFSQAPVTALRLVFLVGTQLLVEIPTDVVTTANIIETGLNVDSYYSDVEEDGVVTPHDKWAKLNEVCSVVFSVFVACALFRVAPLPIF